MNILTVIPIAKGIPKDELSYFSAKPVTLGNLVTVPFGKRTIQAVVIDIASVRDVKAKIKTRDFALRNITTIHSETLPYAIFMTAQKTARFFTQPTGPVLKTMVPDVLFDLYTTTPIAPTKHHNHPNIQTIQTPQAERISMYKTIIRENLAKKMSTMIVVPSVLDAEYLAPLVTTHIEHPWFIVHSKKTKTYLKKSLQTILTTQEPIIMITTAPYASCIRNDWDTIIIDQSGSPYYRYDFSPKFNMRYFIEQFATTVSARLILGDSVHDPEIIYMVQEHKALDMRSVWKLPIQDKMHILDMKPKQSDDYHFTMIDPMILETIPVVLANNGRILLVTSRIGVAGTIICKDCGASVTCPLCDTPMSLHRKNKPYEPAGRAYICHHCFHTTKPQDTCTTCQGSRLEMLGITTSSVAEFVEKKFPSNTCFVIDSETTKTPATISKTIDRWNTEGGILITTPAVLPILPQADLGCFVSLDTLLSLPHIQSGYQTIRSIFLFLEKIQGTAFIQTRLTHHEIIDTLSQGTVRDMMTQELTYRKTLHYPPFTTLIKITASVSDQQVLPAQEYFKDIFREYEHDVMIKKSGTAGEKNVTALLRIPSVQWNDETFPLHEIIQSLDQGFVCEVNPDKIM